VHILYTYRLLRTTTESTVHGRYSSANGVPDGRKMLSRDAELTGRFADKPTRGQPIRRLAQPALCTIHGLVNSWTANLKNHI